MPATPFDTYVANLKDENHSLRARIAELGAGCEHSQDEDACGECSNCLRVALDAALRSRVELARERNAAQESARHLSAQRLAAIDIILLAADTPISTEVLRALGYGGA